jgi:hypothetical protein
MASIWGGDDPSVAWGENTWQSNTVPISISGLSFSTGFNSSVTVTTEINVGWGSDAYGYENWGSSGLVVEIDGLDIGTVEVGENGWGTIAYGESTWGEWNLTPADVVGLTGVEVTASQGTSSIQVDYVDTPSGLSITASQGTGWSVNNGADMVVGAGSQSFSASVGAIAPADVVGLTGVEFTAYQNAAGCSFIPQELINISGVSFTASVGAITPDAMTVSFSGVSFSGSVGSISPTDMSVGLTSLSISGNVGELYPVYFKDVDIESSAGYEDVDIEGSTTYTDVNIAA